MKKLSLLGSLWSMANKIGTPKGKEFVESIDENFTEVEEATEAFELMQAFKIGNSVYQESVFTGEDLTQVNYWTDSTKEVKLFTKDIVYDLGNPVTIIMKNEVTDKILTTTINYLGDEIASVNKIIT